MEKNDVYSYLEEKESNARTYAKDFPIVIQHGILSRLIDNDGKSYIDCLAGAGTLALGHNHPEINNSIKNFFNDNFIIHGLDLATSFKAEFVKTLLNCFPKSFGNNVKVQFCGPTGSDAVEAAIKLFKIYTKRSTIIAFQGAYHGMSNGALSLTGNRRAKKDIQSMMPNVHFMPYPYDYRCPFGVGGKEAIDINLNYFRNTLMDPNSGISEPAAVIMEIVQGEGGCIPAPDDWVRGVRKITSEFKIPLIIDEVQTGFGRTGYMFSFESSGITPDAVVVSKAVGGGLPISALIYNKRFDVWKPGAHAGTFRGNQLAMVAGTAVMNYIVENNIVMECREKGEYFLNKLKTLKRNFPLWGDVRGKGLMVGIEIDELLGHVHRVDGRTFDSSLTKVLQRECLNRGLIIETGGRNNSVLRFLPPLIITYEEIDEIIDIVCAATEKVMEKFIVKANQSFSI